MDTSRRRILKTIGASAAAAAVGTVNAQRLDSANGGVPPPKQPNILIFLTDDHAQWLQQSTGNTEVHHLDTFSRHALLN